MSQPTSSSSTKTACSSSWGLWIRHSATKRDSRFSAGSPLNPSITTDAGSLLCTSHLTARATSRLFALLFLAWLSFFVLQLLIPSDLCDNNQERPAAYVLDATVNGNWICQRDDTGDIMSKPPLLTWLQALATLPFGRGNLFSLFFPNAVAVLLAMWLIFRFGTASFGRRAGFFAAMIYLLCPAGLKQIAFARTDPLFTCLILSAALVAYRARLTGRGWVTFWVIAAAITLTKGPLGVLMAAGGLLGLIGFRRDEHRSTCIQHVGGMALFLAITVGWGLLAYAAYGQDLIAKMIGKELVGHMTGQYKNIIPGTLFYKPTLYVFSRFLPWSPLVGVALWRMGRRPTHTEAERLPLHFLRAYLLASLALLSLSPHQRADLVLPLLPAAALLAGRELASLIRPTSTRRFLLRWAVGLGLCLLVSGIYYGTIRTRHRRVIQTRMMQEFARSVQERLGPESRLVYVDVPFAAQFFLNTMRPRHSYEEAARLLAGPDAVLVATQRPERIREHADPTLNLTEILRVPETGPAAVVVLSNRPAPHATAKAVLQNGSTGGSN